MNRLLCDGLRRHTALTISTFTSVEKMLGTADLAVAVFDDADNVTADVFVKRNIAPFTIAVGKLSPGMNGQNVFSLPFRLGTLIDAIRQNAIAGMHGKPFQLGPWLVSGDGSTLIDGRTSKTVRLTEKERDILMRLHKKMGHVIDRQELLNEIWGYGKEIETHTLETHIYRLRQKIEQDPAKPQWLITEDTGYRLELKRSNHNP